MPASLRWLLNLVITNPVCVRLVQGGSRRSRHFYIRSIYLFVVMVTLFLLILPQGGRMKYKELALEAAGAFQSVAYLQIALICILAPVFMAGAIAQESNPRTWEILLTTPLSAAQLVLGHLFGRLFFVLALLFASLPFFALTQYFGGVPGRSIFLSYAVAACAALLVGAVAITLAVNRLAGRRAVFAYCVSMVTYIGVTWAIDRSLASPWGGVTFMTPLNPFLALQALLDPTGYPRPDDVALGAMSGLARLWYGSPVLAWCLASGGLSLILVLASTITVRRVGTRGGARWYRRPIRSGESPESHRAPRRVWHNPVAWREAAARQATLVKMILRWSFIAAGAAWGVGLVIFFHNGALSIDQLRFQLLATIWIELMVIVLIALNVSATAISREREDGTLDLLLTTPITPGQYLGGKLRGLISYLLPLLAVPLGTIFLASLYTLVAMVTSIAPPNGIMSADPVPESTLTVNTPVILPELGVLLPIVTIPFLALCVMIGLQWSVKSKGTISSVVATVGVVGVIMGIIGLCGFKAGESVPFVGPFLAAFNPLVVANAGLEIAQAFAEPIDSAGGRLAPARISLAVGAVATALAFSLVIYGIHANMVRTFDMTVRRLSGTR